MRIDSKRPVSTNLDTLMISIGCACDNLRLIQSAIDGETYKKTTIVDGMEAAIENLESIADELGEVWLSAIKSENEAGA
jgi:hypothetical protein